MNRETAQDDSKYSASALERPTASRAAAVHAGVSVKGPQDILIAEFQNAAKNVESIILYNSLSQLRFTSIKFHIKQFQISDRTLLL